jgi:monovalent cation:H+ antiporter, CPA1 family
MSGALLTTLGGFALVLLAAAAIPPLTTRLRLPAATLQASLGIGLGLLVILGAGGVGDGATTVLAPLTALLVTLSDLGAQGILAIFLPPILFDAALRVDTRLLIADLASVFLLAVVAVLLTTFLVAGGLVAFTTLPALWAILVGAVVATTDPSAVLGVFREVGAPRRLQALVEGESLLNDAAAIVLVAAIVEVLQGVASADPAAIGLAFLWTFAGGGLLGAAMGWLAAVVVARLRISPDAALTVSLALPYLAFVGAERYLEASGVVAVVMSGLVLGRALDLHVPPALGRQVLLLWGQLANWAGALIVVGATLLVPVTLRPQVFDLGAVVVVTLACLGARALVLYGLIPGLAAAGIASPVSPRFRLAMLWGGLRGAVTVALALTVAADPELPPFLRERVGVLACAFVVVTLFVQAPTLRPLLRSLGLGGLSRLDQVVRERAARAVGARLADRLSELRVRLGLDVPGDLVDDMRPVVEEITPLCETARSERIAAAIAAITEREAERYRELYDEGIVGREAAAALIRGPRDLGEALRGQGLAAYATAAKRELGYERSLRSYLWLYRKLGWSRPLARALALRYEVILVRRAVLIGLRRDVSGELEGFMGEEAAQRVDTLLSARLDAHQKAVDGLRHQYPAYARELETRFLRRAGLRLEAEVYRELQEDGLLSGAAGQALARQVAERRRESDRLPALDLRLEPTALLERVPLFEQLDRRSRRRLRRALRPGLAVPGDRLIRKGDVGDGMYFLVDGAVAVQWPQGRRTLGTGDVFGETALITGQRRSADVVALTYVQYLWLGRDDYRRLTAGLDSFGEEIARLARERGTDRAQVGVSRETTAGG